MYDNSRCGDTVSSASFLFENHYHHNKQSQLQSHHEHDLNNGNHKNRHNETLRSSSMKIRGKREGIGYKNGLLRLVEHDRISNSSE